MKNAAIASLLFLSSGIAVGYPEVQAEHGYSSCAACHVSPSGGGVLTDYGRGFGEELSTVHQDNAGAFAYGLVVPPDWFLIGGDTRYLDYRTAKTHQDFLMQRDVEVALRPSKELTVVASYGSYYGDAKPESRRDYVAWSPNDNVTVRVGHFIPSYGLNIEDHTAPTRASLGFGEGTEQYAAEASYRDKYSEIFLTAAAGDGTTFTARQSQGTVAPANNSYLARASWFAAPGYTLGMSYEFKYDSQHIFEQTMGPYAMIGLGKSYLLSEFDRRFAGGSFFDVSYNELGYEIFRGVHLQAIGEYGDEPIYGAGLQLFPVAHIEMLARGLYEPTRKQMSSELLLHLNW